MSGKGIPFRRIRRVTGYLSETARMNNSKQAEVNERVKHVEVKDNEIKLSSNGETKS